MKKAYLKDSRKMFKNNLIRFISIVIIIMLGTAFFIGMNSVAPAMEDTAEEYMKNKNIFDISLSSNLGYTQDDIEKFKQNESITEIKGEYTYDALTAFEEEDIVVRFLSITDDLNINQNDIFEGRNVKKVGECLISSKLRDIYGYEIGDKIRAYILFGNKIKVNYLSVVYIDCREVDAKDTYINYKHYHRLKANNIRTLEEEDIDKN